MNIGFGVVTANELHVPISDSANPRPTYLKMSSADVTHSFWVPRLAGEIGFNSEPAWIAVDEPFRSPASTWVSAHSTAERNTRRCCSRLRAVTSDFTASD